MEFFLVLLEDFLLELACLGARALRPLQLLSPLAPLGLLLDFLQRLVALILDDLLLRDTQEHAVILFYLAVDTFYLELVVIARLAELVFLYQPIKLGL